MAVLYIKNKLLILEYIDRGYIVIDNNYINMPIIYKPDNCRTNTPAT